MRLRAFLALAVGGALVPALLGAQPGVAVDVRRLTPGVDSLAVFYVRGGDTVQTGIICDELAIVEEGGRRVVRRTYGTLDKVMGDRRDTMVDLAATLAPVRHRSVTERGREALDFGAAGATGWLWLANGDSVAVRTALPAGAIHSSSFDLVLRAADLREGWSAEVPAFLPPARAVVALRARVAGVEAIGGDPCWKVEAEFTGMPVTFWISQRSRALRQQVMRIRPTESIVFRAASPPASTPGRAS